ncbi:nucleotidyltransferase domain-containing protein [bacterium]|jgi:predicted nucleotidyltransferase|nr:nucleotidyltransferase domain-containing protein [bacterium]
MMNKEKIKSELIQILGEEVVFAYVFGSVTSGRLHPQSDVDIGVYLREPPGSLDDKLAFIRKVSAVFNRDVDVIFLNDADIIITMQILTNGELLVNNDPERLVLFKASKVGEYADFKISRQIIEQNMLSGRIYA